MWKDRIASLFLGAVLSGTLGFAGCASSNPSFGPEVPADAGVPEDLTLPSQDLAVPMCQITPQGGCAPGFKCTSRDGVSTVCDPDGNTARGLICTRREGVDSCYAGNACVQTDASGSSGIGICRAFCRTDTECGNRSYCEIQLAGTTGYRVCTQFCNALGAGCPSPLGCYVFEREHTDCRTAGTRGVGQPCFLSTDCQPGHACLGPAGAGACYRLCRFRTNGDCPNFQRCLDVENDDRTLWTSYGACSG
jgi:hypothetical protein